MYSNVETFVVVEERHQQNIIVTINFNEAIKTYFCGKGPNKYIEVWCEGKRTDTFHTIEDLIMAGRVNHVNYGSQKSGPTP